MRKYLLRTAMPLGELYAYLGLRRKAASGTWMWGVWLTLWLPVAVLFEPVYVALTPREIRRAENGP